MTGKLPNAGFWKITIWLLPPLLVALAAITWFECDGISRFQRPALHLAPDAPKDEFERRVRDYLLDHPDVIMEAVSRFEARQRTEEESAGQKTEGPCRRNLSGSRYSGSLQSGCRHHLS